MGTPFSTLRGLRVVASPAAVDELVAEQTAPITVLRIAPDDVFLVGSSGTMRCRDPHAIIETEHGFSGCWLSRREFDESVRVHMEWAVPTDGKLGQGLIAGVAAKVHVEDNVVLVLCPTAFVHELAERLG